MSNRLIDIVDITKSYGDSVILDQLEIFIYGKRIFDFAANQWVRKTTLLRILGGFETPDFRKDHF